MKLSTPENQVVGSILSRRSPETLWPWRLLLIFATGVAMTLAFPPFYAWPMALLALAPLGVSILIAPLGWRWLSIFYVAGLLYFLIDLFWLIPVTFGGYFVLCLYMGVYWPAFAWILNLTTRRLNLPAVILIPIIFTALEYLRSTLFSGLSWFMLGTALAPATHLLQVADLFGVSGLTFLCGISAGWLTDLSLSWLGTKPLSKGRILWETTAVTIIFTAVLAYGTIQLRQPLESDGPTIAVISGDVPQSLKDAGGIAIDKKLFTRFFRLSIAAAREHPDLIAWPETMVPGFFNRQWLSLHAADFHSHHAQRLLKMDQDFSRQLTIFSKQHQLSFLVGSAGIRFVGTSNHIQTRNIAIFISPKRGESPPYAKHHLVPFGEYVPFEYWPWLHRLLLSLTPFGPNDDYSLTPGRHWRRFKLHANDRTWRFGTPICYEDAMPRPSQMFAHPHGRQKGVEFLMSISNDGWYQSRTELLQHLQMDQVRAVEERVPIARSVNGGDSGFVDSDGRILQLVQHNGETEFISGFSVHRLPIDPRISLFSRIGDSGVRLLVLVMVGLVIVSLGVASLSRFTGRRHEAD